jgi:hypothetical protein
MTLIRGILITLLCALAFNVQAQIIPTATTRADINVYAGAGREFAVIGQFTAETTVTIEGRSDIAQWMLVNTADLRGWVASGSMILADGLNLYDLPIVDEQLSAEMPTVTPITDDPNLLAIIDRLNVVPMLYNLDSEATRAIFVQGQELGMRANVFTRVGDSNTTSGAFMNPIGMRGNFCDFGAYSYLQETVDFFSVSPQPGEDNSFNSYSVAAVNGLSTAAALDPFWADSTVCLSGESPLACEFRLVRPSVVIIMLGLMDIQYFTTDESREYIREIVEFSIEQGVIPVWTTFPVLPDNGSERVSWERSIEFNGAILDVIEEFGTPLIHLWRAVQTLPDFGIGPDRVHLAEEVGAFCDFTGPEQEIGGTLRNLLTLQALDELRRAILQN